jgi:DNA-binding transcriptional MerR regulator
MKSEKNPSRLFYTLDEVSRLAKIEPKVVENWESEFPFIHAGRAAGGQKIFRQKDLDVILRLKELLITERLTLAGAKRRIEAEFEGGTAVPVHPDRLRKTLFEVKEQLEDLASSLRKRSRRV